MTLEGILLTPPPHPPRCKEGPPLGGLRPSLRVGGDEGGWSGGFLRGSSHGDDVIPEDFLEDFLGGDHVFRWLKEG